MVQVTFKPREVETKMSDEKRAKETSEGGTMPKPELHTVRFEWPGLQVGPGSDVLFYKPNQRRPAEVPQGIQSVNAFWLPSPQGAPWQYSGLNENVLAVKKFNYLAGSNISETDDGPVARHIHEHHHYGHRFPAVPSQAKPMRYERHGYLLKVDSAGVTVPPLQMPNHDIGVYHPLGNQRAVENGPFYHQYGPHYNCPYYSEIPNAPYQIVPYPEVNTVDQHYHFHQHYYHPHYQYQSAVKYQHSQLAHLPQQSRFLPQQQPHYHIHQHASQFPLHHTRPYFAYSEGFNWFSQGPFPRPPYLHNEYDLSALKEVLRTL